MGGKALWTPCWRAPRTTIEGCHGTLRAAMLELGAELAGTQGVKVQEAKVQESRSPVLRCGGGSALHSHEALEDCIEASETVK